MPPSLRLQPLAILYNCIQMNNLPTVRRTSSYLAHVSDTIDDISERARIIRANARQLHSQQASLLSQLEHASSEDVKHLTGESRLRRDALGPCHRYCTGLVLLPFCHNLFCQKVEVVCGHSTDGRNLSPLPLPTYFLPPRIIGGLT